MKINFRRLLLLLVAVCAAQQQSAAQALANGPKGSTAQQQQQPRPAGAGQLDLGSLDGGNYVNDSFGLSFNVPQDWVVVSAQRRGEITKESKAVVGTDDQKKQSQINDSIERSTILLALTKRPAGEPANAAFMLIAERIPSPAFKTGADVLRSLETVLKGTQFNVEFQGGIRTEQIGGAEFGVATMKNSSPRGVLMQKAYVTMKNGYSLQLFYTYVDEADLAAFDAIIKSVKVK